MPNAIWQRHADNRIAQKLAFSLDISNRNRNRNQHRNECGIVCMPFVIWLRWFFVRCVFLIFLSFNEFRLQPFADRTVCVFVPWCILIETIKCMRRPIFDGRHIYAVWYEHTNQKKTNNGLTEPQDKIEQTQWKGSQKLKMITTMLNSFQIICISMVNWLWRCGSAFNVFFCFLFFDYIVAKRQWHSFTYIFDAKASNSCAAFQMAWNFYWIHISCECEI